MELLVGLIMELRLGMATYGTLMGDAMGLPPIYGADPGSMGQGGVDGAAGGPDNGT